MSRMCDKCIKRKTMWCPNSSECYNSQEVPYFMNNVMALQELERYKNIIDDLEQWLDEETKLKNLDEYTLKKTTERLHWLQYLEELKGE